MLRLTGVSDFSGPLQNLWPKEVSYAPRSNSSKRIQSTALRFELKTSAPVEN
jgi:hypothetical protein